MEWIRPAIIVVLCAIIASLGLALYHLATDSGDSKKLVNSLTLRIVLSVVLFLLLMLAWRFGLVRPHGLRP